jgi:DNA-binding transcriptional LysR family regulator
VRGEPFDPAQSRDRLRVAVTDNGSIVLLPALTQRIRTTAPDMTLEIVAWHDRSFEDVEAGKIDLAVSSLTAPSALETERLFKEDFVCLLGADHEFRSRRFTLKQYLELSHVVVGALDRPLADLGLRRRAQCSVPCGGGCRRRWQRSGVDAPAQIGQGSRCDGERPLCGTASRDQELSILHGMASATDGGTGPKSGSVSNRE